LTDDDLKIAYGVRSKLVHAESFISTLSGTTLPTDDRFALYDKLERLLRETVKRSLLDQGFGDFFRDDDAIKKRFPI